MADLPASAPAIAAAVRAGEVTATEVVQAALDRIAAADRRLAAVVASDAEAALAAAGALDRRRPDERGALAGVPFLVKDVEDAAGYRTTYGSLLHASDPLATRDAATVARLKAAGAVVVGKTNTPEHAHAAATANRVFPPTANPWSWEHGVGGSSGGSAAAVAAGLVPLATASDGGGSIRIPAAVCGLVGHKPTLGFVPHGDPSAPDWRDLSSRGLLASDLAGTLAGYDVLTGLDPLDLRSVPGPVRPWSEVVRPEVPATIAWSPDLGYARVDRGVAAACEAAARRLAEATGAELVEVGPVFDEDPARCWMPIAMAGTERVVDWSRRDELDPNLLGLLEGFGRPTRQELLAAEDRAHALNQLVHERVFARHRLLLTPTVAGFTGPAGMSQGTVDGHPVPTWVAFTYPWNLTRQPASSVPCGLSEVGLPIGLQVVGRRFDDVAVLGAVAAALEALPPLPAPPGAV